MTIEKYEHLTGVTLTDQQKPIFKANIRRSQARLESMLGYTLDESKVYHNEYKEIGKTHLDCSCLISNISDLEPADEVEYGYRLYSYNTKDKYFYIDPAKEIFKVKLVKDGVTFDTLDPEDYRSHFKNGFVKYIERCEKWCGCNSVCHCTQLAVDAEWLWIDCEDLPVDLLSIWVDAITFYSSPNKDIKSQTLGTHSYTLFDREDPFSDDENMKILRNYAGPNGTLYRFVTV